MVSFKGLLPLWVVLLLNCCLPVIAQMYSGTPVQRSPLGIPTLVYNCAKMPAICKNVDGRNPLTALNSGGLGALDAGRTPNGQNYLELWYDSNARRKRARRRVSCPRSWKNTQLCPETTQPPTIPRGASWSQGGGRYQAVRYNPNNAIQGQAGFNRIANRAGNAASGSIWTCDEWPAATFTQGDGGGRTACAPQNSKCNGQGNGQDNEQDFQGRSHSLLRNHVWTQANPQGVFVFHFQTTFVDQANVAAAGVLWYTAGGGTQDSGYQKRNDAAPPMMEHFDALYEDRTVLTSSRHMTHEENVAHFFRHNVANGTMPDLTMGFTQLDGLHKLFARAAYTADRGSTNTTIHSPARQHFNQLPNAPPLPLEDITRVFIRQQAGKSFLSYLDQILGGIPSRLPGILGAGSSTVSSLVRSITASASTAIDSTTTFAASALSSKASSKSSTGSRRSSIATATLQNIPTNIPLLQSSNPFLDFKGNLDRRQTGPGSCSASSPCPDGSCCNNKGLCGYGPENCGQGNCTGNCDAKALCGRDSEGGAVKCPLNVCCSYYGYCGTDADFCNSPNPSQPCQQGFGSCKQVPAPSCGGSSATQRTIAYYQVANVRERQCNRISVSQINTTGLTHLNLAFAGIDPTSFEVVPGSQDDIPIYKQFTALKSSTLQTWIALGGWDFNDPGSTRTTWSDLSSTSANRAKFISSVKNFMSQYGFQGVDLDWEYPGAPDRAGKKEDTQNLVALVKEMRASFGSTYGISATLPSSYWYLRWFDPKGMAPYVDFFGLMSYDLHGLWDAGVKQIGQKVLGHTNIPEISNWTQPLWYPPIDPAKIVFGLAYYGRGYTLSDANCNTPGCSWKAGNRPGPCTNFAGVMSLQEIQNLIPQIGAQPKLNSQDMMKYLTWSDQWMGYDDMQTIAMKRQWASSRCFGGTMIWSIDLFSGSGSGDTPDGGGSSNPSDPGAGNGQGGSNGGKGSGQVYIDPGIWSSASPTIQCQPPCTFILPPYTLSKPTTISFPPYTTSLDVAWSESTGWVSTVQTTTLTIPAVTTTLIEVWAFKVTDSNTASSVSSTFFVTSSIRPSPFVITDDPNPKKQSGVSHPRVTRTITPPPYPYSFTRPASSSTTTTTDAAVIFPIVTYKPGPPKPTCKSGCGKPCIIFCSAPCLINCIDGGNDFPDPVNPKPPPRPTPVDPTGPKPPTGTPVPVWNPNPDGTEPDDPDEEDEDQECAFEFNQPAPTYSGSIGVDASSTISPPPNPPTTQPSADPQPPGPNRETESLKCFNSGFMTGRGSMIDAIKDFCKVNAGTVLDASNGKTEKTIRTEYPAGDYFNGGYFGVMPVSVTVKNGCKFTIDEGECNRIYRRPTDECDTTSTKYKQGGYVSNNCAEWRIDPNANW